MLLIILSPTLCQISLFGYDIQNLSQSQHDTYIALLTLLDSSSEQNNM